MDDKTAVISENWEIAGSSAQNGWTGTWSGVSWSAVIAGALTAIAVTVIVIALGSGIGMTLASPYSYSSAPSAGTLSIIGAVWLVFAQAVGFATGGYVAGRLRRGPAAVHTDEVKFRDGANGLIVWAIGVVVSSVILATAVDKVGSAAGTAATGTAIAGLASAANQTPSMDYFTDTLLRTNPQTAANNTASNNTASNNTSPGNTAPSGAADSTLPAAGSAPGTQPNNAASNNAAQRGQINRIMLTALGPNGLSTDDRTYLAQIVSQQAGISPADAQHRVDDVVNRAKAQAMQAVDKAREAAAYLSFWTFMSLLFGAVCATLGGILGGDLRDDFAIRQNVSTSVR
jgi:hypothetical protein